MKTAQGIRKEYGSIKAALQHCISLNMNILGMQNQLECSRAFIYRWAKTCRVELMTKGKDGAQKGTVHNPHAYRLKRSNYLRALVRRGYPLHDPETIYKAERLAGMRGA